MSQKRILRINRTSSPNIMLSKFLDSVPDNLNKKQSHKVTTITSYRPSIILQISPYPWSDAYRQLLSDKLVTGSKVSLLGFTVTILVLLLHYIFLLVKIRRNKAVMKHRTWLLGHDYSSTPVILRWLHYVFFHGIEFMEKLNLIFLVCFLPWSFNDEDISEVIC